TRRQAAIDLTDRNKALLIGYSFGPPSRIVAWRSTQNCLHVVEGHPFLNLRRVLPRNRRPRKEQPKTDRQADNGDNGQAEQQESAALGHSSLLQAHQAAEFVQEVFVFPDRVANDSIASATARERDQYAAFRPDPFLMYADINLNVLRS